VGDCAAACEAVRIASSEEGRKRLQQLVERTRQFRQGVEKLGWETIPGPHPIVPLLVRDTAKARRLVEHFYENGVLVVGLTYPVVPRGEETLRFQINAAHTEQDIAFVLDVLGKFSG
jgi:glycine C-acetyltransferase